MIIYNVTIKIESEVADIWVRWMKAEHMPQHMSTGLFSDCRLSRLLEQDEAEGVTYTAQYFCETIEDYNKYIDEHADKLNGKSYLRFGGKFVGFQTVMEII